MKKARKKEKLYSSSMNYNNGTKNETALKKQSKNTPKKSKTNKYSKPCPSCGELDHSENRA